VRKVDVAKGDFVTHAAKRKSLQRVALFSRSPYLECLDLRMVEVANDSLVTHACRRRRKQVATSSPRRTSGVKAVLRKHRQHSCTRPTTHRQGTVCENNAFGTTVPSQALLQLLQPGQRNSRAIGAPVGFFDRRGQVLQRCDGKPKHVTAAVVGCWRLHHGSLHCAIRVHHRNGREGARSTEPTAWMANPLCGSGLCDCPRCVKAALGMAAQSGDPSDLGVPVNVG